jgi:hypothetical protein
MDIWGKVFQYLWQILGGVALVLLLIAWKSVRVWIENHKPSSLVRFTKANKVVYQILSETRVQFEADRVYVIQFRNGTTFDNRTPMFRLFMTHEVLLGGTASATKEWDGMIASQVYEMLAPFFEDGDLDYVKSVACEGCPQAESCIKDRAVYWYRVGKLAEGFTKSFFISQAIKGVAISPMLDVRGRIVGFVGADFRSDDAERLHPDNLHLLCYASSNIAFVLREALQTGNGDIAARDSGFWRTPRS